MDAEKLQIQAEGELANSDMCRELLASPVFQAFLDEEFDDARDRCVRVVENHSSNYEKAMAAGILRYWRAKRKGMEDAASDSYRQKRVKRLEELNGERSERPRKSGSFVGIKAYGQF